jgi:hypothetical protein
LCLNYLRNTNLSQIKALTYYDESLSEFKSVQFHSLSREVDLVQESKLNQIINVIF